MGALEERAWSTREEQAEPEALPAGRPALHLAKPLLLSNCALPILYSVEVALSDEAVELGVRAVLCICRMRARPLIG